MNATHHATQRLTNRSQDMLNFQCLDATRECPLGLLRELGDKCGLRSPNLCSKRLAHPVANSWQFFSLVTRAVRDNSKDIVEKQQNIVVLSYRRRVVIIVAPASADKNETIRNTGWTVLPNHFSTHP